MNRTKIKNYAPQARRDFLQAVKDRAAFHGLTAERTEPVTTQGDVAIIGGRAFPREVGAKRKALQERVDRDGYGPTMEALAYTWFNRLVAIRYMELHGYFEHGYRVLSNPDPARAMPEILDQAEHVELPDLSRDRVIERKLDGTKEAELYRMLLVAQCNALHSAMPFLFERIGDETELVLPESLLHSDSIVRKLVSGIDEEDWQEVEVIGWLYEAYVSERYEAVIGSVVASADIPAATQRFTPKWIVRYLVQNTLGRLWLATYPLSPLKGQMKYYIDPAEQTPEVQEQLRAITPTSLNPEEITFLDPACGSAHILVEAYDLFKSIYQERGYRARDIPRLILSKNLFGLEIDDRAAQLAAFALMMKARADDRRVFDQGIHPQVRALVQTDGMDAEDIATALNVSDSKEMPPPGQLFETEDNLFTRSASTAVRSPYTSLTDVTALVDLFQHAKTFGSLIQVPPALAARLPQIEQRCREVAGQTNEIASRTAARFLPVIEQARMLAFQYDCVVANPPYMNSKYFNALLKGFVNQYYGDAKADICVAFIERAFDFIKSNGFIGEITMQGWMFLPSFENFRTRFLRERTIYCMAHLGPHAFPNIGGQVVQVTAFVANRRSMPNYRTAYLRLVQGSSDEKERRFSTAKKFTPCNSDLEMIPGSPLSYWASSSVYSAFAGAKIADAVVSEGYVKTGKNAKYIRCQWEVSSSNVGQNSKWRQHPRGGDYRKWYGNVCEVVNWSAEARQHYKDDPIARILDPQFWDIEGVCWSEITIANPAFRLLLPHEIANKKSAAIYPKPGTEMLPLLAFLNSSVAGFLLSILNPTIGFGPGDVHRLPLRFPNRTVDTARKVSEQSVPLARLDWDSFETSWDFRTLPVLQHEANSLLESQDAADAECLDRFRRMKELEEENNRVFLDVYGLQDALSPEVPDDQITLYRPNREEDIKRLISYAVGCTMGRYSLDTPGLVYAHGGNVGFEPGQYRTFPADPDGIVPVMEADWFADDATHRFVEFLGVAWPREYSDENLKFVADALGPSKGEQPRDTIRRYLATGFYKHHLQTYKRRPIYWLFSSGKQRAFQCLVYLHRYHEGTLARMRTEYVIPLIGKLKSRIDQLKGEIGKANSTSHRKSLQKELDKLNLHLAELAPVEYRLDDEKQGRRPDSTFDEKLRHHADMRIKLDLDDGVKVNYGKFGDLLAEVKAVTGGREEE